MPTACITVREYGTHPGDTNSVARRHLPRSVSRYIVRAGAATPILIGRTWYIYSESLTNGWLTSTRQTIRAHAPGAAIGDPANACSSVTSFDNDAPGIALLLRGRPLASRDEDGTRTYYDYRFGAWDSQSRSFSAGAASSHLETTIRRYAAAGAPHPTITLTVEDATHGTQLYSATKARLPGESLSDPFEWQSQHYDNKNRLRATHYADGSCSTNAWSCCRLLWTIDRQGARTLRSATTGTDHLYHAMEEVSLGNLPHHDRYIPYENMYASDKNAFRTTQYFMDALGRQTNIVVRPAKTAEMAVDPYYVYNRGWRTSETVEYPDGTSDYAVHTDMRGVRTVSTSSAFADRSEYYSATYHPTNTVTPLVTELSTTYHNGPGITRREAGDDWTEETSLTDYDASGCRYAVQISASSDYGVVTNSITRYDFFGNVIASLTPAAHGGWLVTSNFYNSARQLVSNETRCATGLLETTTWLYNAYGERTGQTRHGVTSRSDTTYEAVSNVLWRIVTQLAHDAADRTNAVVVTRKRLTGLSDSLRHESFTWRDGTLQSQRQAAFDAATDTLSETGYSPVNGTTIRRSRYGRTLETATADGTRYNYFDPYGRVFQTDRTEGASTNRLYESWIGYNDYGDIVEYDIFHASGDNVIATFHVYDAFGRQIATTNALGEVEHSTYDALGRLSGSSGTVYPVRHGYDSAGRRTTLQTTRDGTVWDTTTWQYEPATGVLLKKQYASPASHLSYSYTPDGRQASRIWARGTTTSYDYNAAQLLSGTEYSDHTPDVTLAYDSFLRLSSAASAPATYSYTHSHTGNITNETDIIGGELHRIGRSFDPYQRLTALEVNDDMRVQYSYNRQARIATISNNLFAVEYLYSPDGYDAGYRLITQDGLELERVLVRDSYRRQLITVITNRVNATPLNTLDYSYDFLNRIIKRNNDTFDYNPRSEVTIVSLATNGYAYAYDDIGNLLSSAISAPSRETFYTANELNQYTNILRAPASPREMEYDLDGNLTNDSTLTYTWDAENRLVAVYDDSTLVISNAYDHASRRVLKVTPDETRTFLYDGWNLVQETIATAAGVTTNHYIWGKDLSGTLQGAGGVGGLLAVCLDNSYYFPLYDNNGNITDYIDEYGSIAAHREYDAFGNTITVSETMSEAFNFWYSTKYLDHETGFYYYGYRFYSPSLMRWLNRDPIEEAGGFNLYGFLSNLTTVNIDILGLSRWVIIYYSKDNQMAFKYAAETAKKEIESSIGFNKECDQVIMIGVATAEDFENVWNKVKQQTTGKSNELKIKEVRILSHSGVGRLFFLASSFDSKKIIKLETLNWAPDGKVICHGCNSGVSHELEPSIAESFANSQKVIAEGQIGYSQFSTRKDKRTWFTRINSKSREVFLWSFGKGKANSSFGVANPPSLALPPNTSDQVTHPEK